MAITAYLKSLPQRPEEYRKRFAFWTSFGITAIIFLFWLASWGLVGGNGKQAVANTTTAENTTGQAMTASVSGFSESVGNFFGGMRDFFFGAKVVTYGDVTVTSGKR